LPGKRLGRTNSNLLDWNGAKRNEDRGLQVLLSAAVEEIIVRTEVRRPTDCSADDLEDRVDPIDLQRASYGRRSSIADGLYCLLISQRPAYLKNGGPTLG
jgi:hypothetical protein